MAVRVREVDGGYRIDGDWDGLDAANAFLAHLSGRGFSPATVRAYAFDVLNLARFLTERDLALARSMRRWCLTGSIGRECAGRAEPAPRIAVRSGSAAASTVNRRVAAVRALFEYLVMTGRRADNPVPSPRRGQGLRRSERGPARSPGPGSCPRWRQVGAPAAPASGIVAGQRHRRIPRHAGARIGIGRWCWRCCWAGCGRRRCAACCWRMWTWAGGGCG